MDPLDTHSRQPSPPLSLRLSPTRRHLVREDGSSFFYLGDTAWELFHRLNREEAAHYLENRASKGFTVIQAVALAELDGLHTPNAYGECPLVDDDPTRLNEAYFAHVDWIVEKAASLGLTMGMLPTWGDKWQRLGGVGPQIFDTANARAYGRILGERYRGQPIIWILGGDRNPETDAEHATLEAMALGLREGDHGEHLITFHPRGPGRSSDAFHACEWLDFNMVQSSHAAHDFDNGVFAEHDRDLEPVKPTLDGEPRYETIPVGFYFRNNNRLDRFDAYDARQAAYWSMLAGACGHTYGNNNIWQMWQPGRQPVIDACIPWVQALDHPGAFQMGLARRLFESRPWQTLVPDQGMIVDGPSQGGAKVRAARADDGSFAFVYSPRGEAFTVRMDAIAARRVTQTWYDPRYGAAYPIHTGGNAGVLTFSPPTSGRGNDWVLVLDDAEAGFSASGA